MGNETVSGGNNINIAMKGKVILVDDVYMNKRRGQTTEPCGTPVDTLKISLDR